MPFIIQSGHIHELRIHIPWMALTSESVNATISTIEVSLKLQKEDSSNDEGGSVGDRKSAKSATSADGPGSPRASQSNQANIDAPAGYIESLLLKIKNNLSLGFYICNFLFFFNCYQF